MTASMVSPEVRSTRMPASRCGRPLCAETMQGRLPASLAGGCAFAGNNSPSDFAFEFAAGAPKSFVALATKPPARALAQKFLRVQFFIFAAPGLSARRPARRDDLFEGG